MKELVTSEKGAAPGGAYSPALKVGDFIFVSGQGAKNPETGEMAEGIEAQTAQVMENVKVLIEAAGATMADVVKCAVHLSDINNFQAFNKVYASFFPEPKPARTTVQSGLAPNLLVEIDAIAYKPRE